MSRYRKCTSFCKPTTFARSLPLGTVSALDELLEGTLELTAVSDGMLLMLELELHRESAEIFA